jgi:hypothetical protein
MPPFTKSQIFTLTLKLSTLCDPLAWEDYHNFYFALGAYFAFGEANFHKIRCRKTLSRSHNGWNTTDYNMVLTESFSTYVELPNVCVGI